MGTWGPGISSNDTYADAYDEFMELYHQGLEPSDISHRLIAENQETILDEDDAPNFWFALAMAQWECKSLDPDLLARVTELIRFGTDLARWKELGGSDADLKKRSLALEKFLSKIQTEKKTPKARKKKVIREAIFEKGDCFVFRLADGTYGGAIVLESEKQTEHGRSLLAVSRLSEATKPSIKDLLESEVLVLNYQKWEDHPCIFWYYSPKPETGIQDKQQVELIGKTDINLNYDEDDAQFGSVFNLIGWTKEVLEDQLDWEKTHQKPALTLQMKSYVKKRFWKFW
ncbi:MAG: hypothetical protein NWR72_17080 [Bacteroidia bacterium]|nr:hypothetical protein [Bacteroidia bacterium]